ncbi:MAG: ATP:cob(I)alamin adenosyltransferase, partial [Bacteroidales bacterium]
RIDAMEKLLPHHNRFILPVGVSAATKAHICRTIARRAEREICRLSEMSVVDENIKIFINRLSDYFFILSRYCNYIEDSEELFCDY